MGEGVQQDEPDARITCFGLRNSSGFPPSFVGLEKLVVVGPMLFLPFLQGRFREMEEDALATNLRAGTQVGACRDNGARWSGGNSAGVSKS